MGVISKLSFAGMTAFCLTLSPALAGSTPAPADAKVYFVNLNDGDVVKSAHVKAIFGLSGMGVAPSGVEKENTGHHHLLLDRAPFDAATEASQPIAADEHNIHFGKGQTEKVLKLKPGKHTLQLVLGDEFHEPHNKPVVSEMITITVK
jgi:hypothetical protein